MLFPSPKLGKFLFGSKINDRRLKKSRYESDVAVFKSLGGNITRYDRILSDWDEQAGNVSGHYFHQDILVARFIYENKPSRHVDIGSRIDGFVAHVATFRRIEVLDVRKLNHTGHDNIFFVQADLMIENDCLRESTDSVSCLHAIEHFGLGRYGDPVDPQGHIKGFKNILSMLKPDGMLYISFPIGVCDEVHFNAHRVFHPKSILEWPDVPEMLELIRFDYVDDAGNIHQNVDLLKDEVINKYGCGIYSFKKR